MKETVNITISESFTLEELADLISSNTYQDEIPKLIALIDSKASSWDVTKKLIKHFKQLEILYAEETRNELEIPEELKPELLI